MVIANDHNQSTGIVCLSVIRGVQRVARKRSISFNFQNNIRQQSPQTSRLKYPSPNPNAHDSGIALLLLLLLLLHIGIANRPYIDVRHNDYCYACCPLPGDMEIFGIGNQH